MPTHPAVTGAIVVAGIAVATAVAIYESPQARQFAEEIRRKIAIALHSLGDGIDPTSDHPRFNRPEDAEGFLQSVRRREDDEIKVDVDSQRRQREEILYWNAKKLEKSPGDKQEVKIKSEGLLFNTGANASSTEKEGLRNRGEPTPGATFYTEPMSNLQLRAAALRSLIRSPPPSESWMYERNRQDDEMSEGLYSASDIGAHSAGRADTSNLCVPHDLEDKDPKSRNTFGISNEIDPTDQSRKSRNIFADSYQVEEDLHKYAVPPNPIKLDSYHSIHAWAENARAGSCSRRSPSPNLNSLKISSPQLVPTPTSSSPALSKGKVSIPRDGDNTPTDIGSVLGSDEQVTWWSNPSVASENEEEAMSIVDVSSSAGTWTEVGSVVSDEDVRG